MGFLPLALACRVLVYQFQPVPYDADHEYPIGVAPGLGALEEGGPQIAMWLETPNRSFVADIFVTARTAVFGIGNRPGTGLFGSSPRFPYGARDGVLPVWAFARGHDYPLLVMQDGNQGSFRFHNLQSTVDPFFCRPLLPSEIVDAVTCPTPIFSSDKGIFDPAGGRSLYPPRHDLAQCKPFGPTCSSGCDSADCAMLADLDDVAAISAATPAPGALYTGRWHVPDGLGDGDYVVFLEVSKQYDQDAPRCQLDSDCPPIAPHCDANSKMCVRHVAAVDNMGQLAYGLGSNLGQPSVVWSVPIALDSAGAHVALADDYRGYGDWDHPRGNLFAPDATISTHPGSGAARLARFIDSDGAWRVKVTARPCQPCDDATTPPAVQLAADAPDGDRIEVRFVRPPVDAHVTGWELRYATGDHLDEAGFMTAAPLPPVEPGPPGSLAVVELGAHEGIAAQHTYTIGARAADECLTAPLAVTTVTTPRQSFRTIDGCFIATAAFGSELEPEVRTLRRFRDQVLRPDPFGRAAISLYYGASPPLARAIARSAGARAAARRLLVPLVTVARSILR